MMKKKLSQKLIKLAMIIHNYNLEQLLNDGSQLRVTWFNRYDYLGVGLQY
jgi:hypothetical protein